MPATAEHFARECTVRVYRVIRYEACDTGPSAAEVMVLLGHSPAHSNFFWVNLSIVLGCRDNVLWFNGIGIAGINSAVIFFYRPAFKAFLVACDFTADTGPLFGVADIPGAVQDADECSAGSASNPFRIADRVSCQSARL